MSATPASDVLIRYSEFPDTDWLGHYEHSARKCGDTKRADALAWIISAFHRYVSPVLAEGATDPDIDILDQQVRAGQYRLFEFAVVLEERRLACVAIAQEKSMLHKSGFTAKSFTAWRNDQTYEMVAKEEFHACIDNFLCMTGYAEEFDVMTPPLTRWGGTVPAELPDELRAFGEGYLDALQSIDFNMSDKEALRSYTGHLVETISLYGSDRFEESAGRTHAHRIALFENRIADSRARNAQDCD